jgi:hypothetical protein
LPGSRPEEDNFNVKVDEAKGIKVDVKDNFKLYIKLSNIERNYLNILI